MAILKGYIISKNQLDNITDKTVKIDIDNDGTIWFYNKSNGTNMKTIKEIKIANTLKLYIHKLKNNNNTPIEIEEIELINILKNYFDYELSEESSWLRAKAVILSGEVPFLNVSYWAGTF